MRFGIKNMMTGNIDSLTYMSRMDAERNTKSGERVVSVDKFGKENHMYF